MAARTRLASGGHGTRRCGSFADKAATEAPVATVLAIAGARRDRGLRRAAGGRSWRSNAQGSTR